MALIIGSALSAGVAITDDDDPVAFAFGVYRTLLGVMFAAGLGFALAEDEDEATSCDQSSRRDEWRTIGSSSASPSEK